MRSIGRGSPDIRSPGKSSAGRLSEASQQLMDSEFSEQDMRDLQEEIAQIKGLSPSKTSHHDGASSGRRASSEFGMVLPLSTENLKLHDS